MKTTVYIYLDHLNRVVYDNLVDSLVNRINPELKRFVMPLEAHGIFVKYYRLRLHPKALQNIVK